MDVLKCVYNLLLSVQSPVHLVVGMARRFLSTVMGVHVHQGSIKWQKQLSHTFNLLVVM